MLLSASVQAAEPRPFSGGWFNAKNVGQAGGAQGARPGMNLPGTPPPLAQQQQANQQLQRSLANLGKTASAIAAQQAAQAPRARPRWRRAVRCRTDWWRAG
ncbi:hypothetical protein NFX37_13170 [Serratia marcescens]|nr:hypothetical protein NFX37_13170 [Serratia marcescens]